MQRGVKFVVADLCEQDADLDVHLPDVLESAEELPRDLVGGLRALAFG